MVPFRVRQRHYAGHGPGMVKLFWSLWEKTQNRERQQCNPFSSQPWTLMACERGSGRCLTKICASSVRRHGTWSHRDGQTTATDSSALPAIRLKVYMEAGRNCVCAWIELGMTHTHTSNRSIFSSNRALDTNNQLRGRKIDSQGSEAAIPGRKLPARRP
jgi:hypothetical protein